MYGARDTIRLLHVDDDSQIRALTADLLSRQNGRIDVHTAGSVTEGLELLADREIDCIVSDYDLPGRDGIEFLETVREEHPDVPFILFTGKGSETIASEAISAGVTDYFQKEGGTEQYAVLANKITHAVDRVRSERARERHLEAIETAQEGIAILNDDGRFIYVNDAYAGMYGYEPEEMIGRHWELIYPEEEIDQAYAEILPTVETAGQWQGKTTGLRADGSTFPEDHMVSRTEGGDLVCTVRDRSRREAREQAIERLHTTARRLMDADSREEVSEIALTAVRDILDVSAGAVYVYDEVRDGLALLDRSERAREIAGERTFIPRGEGLAWEAFETGEERVYDDVSEVPGRLNPETEIRSHAILPVGDHGVLLISATTAGAFDATDVSLAEILIRHVGTTLDRIEQTRRVTRERDRAHAQLEATRDGHLLVEDRQVVHYDGRFVDVWGLGPEQADDREALLEGMVERAGHATECSDRIAALSDCPEKTDRAEIELVDGTVLDRYSAPVTGEDGTHYGRLWTFRDITDRKARERELERYERILETTDDVAFVVDEEWTVTYVNRTIEAYVDLPRDGLVGRPVLDLAGEYVVDDGGAEQFERALERTFDHDADAGAAGEPSGPERLELSLALSETVTFEYRLSPVVEDGVVTEVVVTMRDITERKRRERELLRTKNRLDRVVSNVPVVLFAIDEEGVFTLSEGKGLEALGLDPGEVVGLSVFDVYAGYPDVIEAVERALGGERFRTVQEVDGSHFETVYQPVIEDGTVSGVIGVAIDVTEQREYERAIERQNERLEEFAGVVSHDLRNPLNVARARLELAAEECNSDHLAAVERAHGRMEALIDDLLTLAREGRTVTDRDPVELDSLAEECWRTVDTAAGTLVTRTDRTVYADRSRLQQAFENLVRNAVEHGGETVTVAVGGLEDGFYIEDDGPGIPAGEREDVFELGYSTAEEGTGFGLGIVTRIVEAHGWGIRVTDGSEGGARFEITGVEFADT